MPVTVHSSVPATGMRPLGRTDRWYGVELESFVI
jgi:hypothetical protein